MPIIKQLFDHMAWADAALWTAVLALPEGSEDTRLDELLVHIHTVQFAYLNVWRDEPVTIPDPSDFSGRLAISEFGREVNEAASAYVRSLTDADMTRIVKFPWAEQLTARFGTIHNANLRETLQQVVQHSAYHRGQVNVRVRELGGEPAPIDYIMWIWAGKPAAHWTRPGLV